MKFVCDRCQTKYSIADERVRGKVLKVKCKSCANVITVREARAHSSAGVPTLSSGGAGHSRGGAQAALSVPMETPGVDSERTQLAMSPFGAETEGFPDLLDAVRAGAPADWRARRGWPRGRSRSVVHGARRQPHRAVHAHQARGKAGTAREERGRPHLEREAGRLEAAGRHPRDRRRDQPPSRARAAASAVADAPAHAAADAAISGSGGSGGSVGCRTASRRASRPGRTRRRRRSRTRPSRRDRSCRRRAAFIRRSPPEVPSTAPTRHRCWRRRRPSRIICRTRQKRTAPTAMRRRRPSTRT